MATSRSMELIISYKYPNSLKHLQQLLMDCEGCAKTLGKKTIFGGDKFAPNFESFKETLSTCVIAMALDGVVDDIDSEMNTLIEMNNAITLLKDTYSNWQLSFEFWDGFYEQVQK